MIEILRKAQDIAEKTICELTREFTIEAKRLELKATLYFSYGLFIGFILAVIFIGLIYFGTGHRLWI